MDSDITRKSLWTKEAVIKARRYRRHDLRRKDKENLRGLFICVYLSGQVEAYTKGRDDTIDRPVRLDQVQYMSSLGSML